MSLLHGFPSTHIIGAASRVNRSGRSPFGDVVFTFHGGGGGGGGGGRRLRQLVQRAALLALLGLGDDHLGLQGVLLQRLHPAGGGNTVRWGPVNPPRMGLGIDRPTERTGPTGEPIYPSCVWLDPSYWDVPGEDYPGAVDWEDDPSIDLSIKHSTCDVTTG